MPSPVRALAPDAFFLDNLCHCVCSQRAEVQTAESQPMTFDDILAQVLALLQREGRVSYRALKLRIDMNDDYIEGIKDELIYAKKLAMDEDNRVLVWTGDQDTFAPPPVLSISEPPVHPAPDDEREPLSYTPKHLA